jgi:hypothetical protein
MPASPPSRALLLRDDDARLLEAAWTADAPPKLALRSGLVRVWLPPDEAERLRRWLNAEGRPPRRHRSSPRAGRPAG